MVNVAVNILTVLAWFFGIFTLAAILVGGILYWLRDEQKQIIRDMCDMDDSSIEAAVSMYNEIESKISKIEEELSKGINDNYNEISVLREQLKKGGHIKEE